MNYIVYKTTNTINNKIYIGVHRTTNPDIFDGYIGCGVTKKDTKKSVKKGFPEAVRKYGYENFKRETIKSFPDTEQGRNDAYLLESKIVTKDFVQKSDNYNLCIGGLHNLSDSLSVKIVQYDLQGNPLQIWESITSAEKTLCLSSISACLTGHSKYCGKWQWRYYVGDLFKIPEISPKEKSVYQFDLSGNLIKCFRSLTDASKQFQNNQSAITAIGNVCRNITRQAYGYYWSYKCKFDYKPFGTAVAKYNDDGIFLESYTSIAEAGEANNMPRKNNISAAIKGTQKRCGGFRWRYFYGNTSNIKPLR